MRHKTDFFSADAEAVEGESGGKGRGQIKRVASVARRLSFEPYQRSRAPLVAPPPDVLTDENTSCLNGGGEAMETQVCKEDLLNHTTVCIYYVHSCCPIPFLLAGKSLSKC